MNESFSGADFENSASNGFFTLAEAAEEMGFTVDQLAVFLADYPGAGNLLSIYFSDQKNGLFPGGNPYSPALFIGQEESNIRLPKNQVLALGVSLAEKLKTEALNDKSSWQQLALAVLRADVSFRGERLANFISAIRRLLQKIYNLTACS